MMRRLMRDIAIDFWWTLFSLRRAQYGDLIFGRDARKAERRERRWRSHLLSSRAPIHAGFDWEQER